MKAQPMDSSRPQALARCGLLLLLAGVLGCAEDRSSGGGASAPPDGVASIEIVPTSIELIVGGALHLEAIVRDGEGQRLERVPTWSVGRGALDDHPPSASPGDDPPDDGRHPERPITDTSVATVDAHGVVVGIAPGATVVIAEVEGIAAAAPIRVNLPPAVRIDISPSSLDLVPGERTSLVASAFDYRGEELLDPPLHWSSSAPQIVAVDEDGTVEALSLGIATISVQAGAVRGRIVAEVHPIPIAEILAAPEEAELFVGEELQLEATALDEDGAVLSDVRFRWTSDEPAIATVDTAGLVRALGPGEATITASSRGQSAEVTLRIVSLVAAQIGLSPGSASLLVGEALVFKALVLGSDGAPLADQAVEWSSSDEAVATIDRHGKARAIAPGEVDLIAKAGEVQAAATLTVSAPPPEVAWLTWSSVPPSPLLQGETFQLEVIALDADREELPTDGVVWASSDEEVATVDGDGLVLGLKQGISQITAAVGGKTMSIHLRVSELERIEITAPDSLLVGQSATIFARFVDRAGASLNPLLPLQSSDETIVSVRNETTVVAVGPGTATLSASASGFIAEKEIRIDSLSFEEVFVGPTGACALTPAGELYCWGIVARSIYNVPSPFPTPTRFRDLSFGFYHLCGLNDVGEAFCTGDDSYGQLGDATPLAGSHYRRVLEGEELRSIAAGTAYTCGLATSGAAWCWGTSTALGIGPFEAYPHVPTPLAGSLLFRDLSVTGGSTFDFFDVSCGLALDGLGYCWGANFGGELGDGSSSPWSLSPSPLAGGLRFTSIRASTRRITATIPPPGEPQSIDTSIGHGCGVAEDGRGYCWGSNEQGELGNGSTEPSRVPVPISSAERFQTIEVQATRNSYSYSCGLTLDGAVLCWGANLGQVLGDGTSASSPTPVPLVGGHRFRSLGLGESQACGQTVEGIVYCWGASTGLAVDPDDPYPSPVRSVKPRPVMGQIVPAP